jgi:hypothetical protein
LTSHGYLGSRTAIAFNVTIESAVGSAFSDVLLGNDAPNMLAGGGGNDTLNGGGGLDVALFPGARANYSVSSHGSGFDVVDLTGISGTDLVAGCERIQFAGRGLAFDLGPGEAAGRTVRIIGAAFDQDFISPAYVGIGLGFFDAGASMAQVCALVAQVMGLANADFVTEVYTNLVGTAPDATTRDAFASLLQGSGGGWSQGQLLELAAYAAPNAQNIDLVGLQAQGVEFV